MADDLDFFNSLNNAPERQVGPNLEPVNAFLDGEKVFTNLTELSFLRWRDYPELPPSA